jgi:hypothetical protein
MALYFLDASALVKRYAAGTGTSWVTVLREVMARPRPEARLAEVPHAQRVLGDLCAEQNRYPEAEALLKEAVAAFENDDTLVRPLAASLRSYASLCRRTGQADEADALEARAREAEARHGG